MKINKLITSTELLLRITQGVGANFDVSGDTSSPGSLKVTYSGSTTTSGTIPNGSWFHFQADVKTNNSGAGYLKTRINGVDGPQLTGLSTNVGPLASVRLGQTSAAQTEIANLWMALGGYKGAAIARAFLPSSDGTIGLDRSAGSTNYTLVNETSLDQATYVYKNAASFPATDTYGTTDMTDIPVQMLAIGIRTVAVKTGTATVVHRGVIKPSGGSNDLSSSGVTLNTSATAQQFVWEDHPDNATGALSGMDGEEARDMFNGCEFGVQLAAS